MLKEYFENLERRLDRIREKRPQSIGPRQLYAYETARMGRRLFSDQETVVWCGLLAPFDLLNAMDVTPCFVEFVGGLLASTGAVGDFLTESENTGYGTDTCGFHRAVIGAAIRNLMPVSNCIIGTTGPCTGGLTVLENLARAFKKDMFLLHTPQAESEEGIRHLAGRIERMVEFVTEKTGHTLDPDRLVEAVEKTNQARELIVEIYQLAQTSPSPVSGSDLDNFGFMIPLFYGTDAAVRIARAYRDRFQAQVDSGKAGVPDEALRLMWLQNRIQFNEPLVRFLENEYKAVIVVDELNDINWDPIDPRDPFPGMARRAVSIPFTGTVKRRVARLRELAEAYRLDGVINPCHWGCRQGTGSRGLISQGLKEVGVPVLNLEVDCVDPRNFSEGQLRTRLEAFIEMLQTRKEV